MSHWVEDFLVGDQSTSPDVDFFHGLEIPPGGLGVSLAGQDAELGLNQHLGSAASAPFEPGRYGTNDFTWSEGFPQPPIIKSDDRRAVRQARFEQFERQVNDYLDQ